MSNRARIGYWLEITITFSLLPFFVILILPLTYVYKILSRKKNQKMRILHTPADVGGQAWALSRAERALGYQSENIIFTSTKLRYPHDRTLALEKNIIPIKILKRYWLLTQSIFRFSVFHFYFAESFLPKNLDLPWLKFIGKKIFFTFQGCDIRLEHEHVRMSNKTHDIHHKCICNDIPKQWKIWKVKMAQKYADKTFVLNPDLLLVSPTSELLPYTVDFTKESRTEKKRNKNIFIIIHAPTDRNIKGTEFLIEAIEKLKNEGENVELQLLENIPHDKMKEACALADCVVDQLIVGWYGGFAVEMMSLGKPVICYIDERLKHLVPFYEAIPIIHADKHTIGDVIRYYVKNREALEVIAQKGPKFVQEIHDPLKIAQYMTHLYQTI